MSSPMRSFSSGDHLKSLTLLRAHAFVVTLQRLKTSATRPWKKGSIFCKFLLLTSSPRFKVSFSDMDLGWIPTTSKFSGAQLKSWVQSLQKPYLLNLARLNFNKTFNYFINIKLSPWQLLGFFWNLVSQAAVWCYRRNPPCQHHSSRWSNGTCAWVWPNTSGYPTGFDKEREHRAPIDEEKQKRLKYPYIPSIRQNDHFLQTSIFPVIQVACWIVYCHLTLRPVCHILVHMNGIF